MSQKGAWLLPPHMQLRGERLRGGADPGGCFILVTPLCLEVTVMESVQVSSTMTLPPGSPPGRHPHLSHDEVLVLLVCQVASCRCHGASPLGSLTG